MLQNQPEDVHSISLVAGIQTFQPPTRQQFLHTQKFMNYKHSALHGCLQRFSQLKCVTYQTWSTISGDFTAEGLADLAAYLVWKSPQWKLTHHLKDVYDGHLSLNVYSIPSWISFRIFFCMNRKHFSIHLANHFCTAKC